MKIPECKFRIHWEEDATLNTPKQQKKEDAAIQNDTKYIGDGFLIIVTMLFGFCMIKRLFLNDFFFMFAMGYHRSVLSLREQCEWQNLHSGIEIIVDVVCQHAFHELNATTKIFTKSFFFRFLWTVSSAVVSWWKYLWVLFDEPVLSIDAPVFI